MTTTGLCCWAGRTARLLIAAATAPLFATGCTQSTTGPSSPAAAASDIVIADFEGSTYGAWTVTGAAFASGPASGDALRTLEIDNAAGSGVATSEQGEGGAGTGDDRPQGTLTSPEFTIERDYIAFRIAGGGDEYTTCINLLVDGRIVSTATGWNSDRLTPASFDVRPFVGKRARIQLVDRSSGTWGHINADQIVQTDTPERLPLQVAPLYHEHLRPQFHFTARQWAMNHLNPGQRQEGWINDLNGLVKYDGEYHLFAQRWAKCWLHAVSTDLVHWTEFPPAFWEEEEGSGVQSGSIVVDHENTSGLAKPGEGPVMVAFWSRFDNRSQCISYSLDRGRTWTRYDKNPLFTRAERDPKVFWYTPEGAKPSPGAKQPGHWVMMMYGDGQYHILTSANLLNWTDEKNPLPNCFECPDLFQLPIDGNTANRKWVLIQGNGKYSIGAFDGRKFTEESDRLNCDLGPHFYATQSWEDMGSATGGWASVTNSRRVQSAWMNTWGRDVFNDMPFNQQISFPCELTLRTTPKGLRLFREPVREIESLQDAPDVFSARTLRSGTTLPLTPAGNCYRITADLAIAKDAKATFNIRGTTVTLARNTVDAYSGNPTPSGPGKGTLTTDLHHVEFLIDRASIETFVNNGELSASRCFVPTANGISLKAEGGDVVVKSLTLWPLKSAWAPAHQSELIR